jgi:hypothetical protein
MNRRHISEKIRLKVAARAHHQCEYCLIAEMFLATIFHVDHILSVKHGGTNQLENLAYACPHCNQHKGSDIGTFLDAEGEHITRFFNPRKDIWATHFSIEHGLIVSKSPIGEATLRILDFNQIERVILRQALMDAGYYPMSFDLDV